jgi:Protein-L-isoaspartate(D-aspartate) O-methyltransferase (PCMT)
MRRSSAEELAVIRRAYAAQILAEAGVRSAAVERAFAAVPREAFLGRGPWQVLRWGRGYVPTPSADPLHLYANLLVAIRPERKLNNGEPSFHARLMAALAAGTGEHVVHIGAGTGYFTAILAEQVGRRGRITAFEVDADLAARARRLARRPQGRRPPAPAADDERGLTPLRRRRDRPARRRVPDRARPPRHPCPLALPGRHLPLRRRPHCGRRRRAAARVQARVGARAAALSGRRRAEGAVLGEAGGVGVGVG